MTTFEIVARWKAGLLAVACAVVLGGILVACLWPFHSPKNQVAWLGNGNGLRFGRYGTILSEGKFDPAGWPKTGGWTLEIWLRAQNAWESRTLLSFYDSRRPIGLALQQSNIDLLVETGRWGEERRAATHKLYAGGVFHYRPLILLTLTSHPPKTAIYVNGRLIQTSGQFPIPAQLLAGRLVVANSPVENNSWPGELRGLALYAGALSPAQVRRNYENWSESGRPFLSGAMPDERVVAVYVFNEHAGNVIHNQIASGINLSIPPRYLVLNHTLLARPWNEYYAGWDYWKNVAYNIGGFIPLGFIFYPFLTLILRVRRGAAVTIILGGLVSLAVEIFQAYLPTRDSGMTDIITNTLGTALGAGLCVWARLVCERHSRFTSLRLVAALLGDSRREAREEFAFSGQSGGDL